MASARAAATSAQQSAPVTLGATWAFLALAALMVALGHILANGWIAGAGILALSLAVALRERARDAAVGLALLVAFALRAAAAVLHGVTESLPDSTGDARNFHSLAIAWVSEGVLALPSHFTVGAYLYSWLLAALYLVATPSVFVACAANVLLSIGIVLNVHRAVREVAAPRAALAAAWTTALWPALVLYGAIPLREAVLVYALSLAAWATAVWLARDSFLAFVGAFAAVCVGTLFHNGLVVMLPVLLLAALARSAWAWRRGEARAAAREGSAVALVLALGAVVAVAAYRFDFDFLGVRSMSLDLIAVRQDVTAVARSAYLQELHADNYWDVIWQAPIRVAYFLFSPFPWMVRIPRDVVGLLDGLLYAGLVFFAWKGRAVISRRPYALLLVAALAVLLVVFATNTFNAGTALRHRAKLAPLLIVLAWTCAPTSVLTRLDRFNSRKPARRDRRRRRKRG